MKIEIDIPEGYEVDTENSTKECIKLKKIENKLPKTWEEFCKTHPRKCGESFLDVDGKIGTINCMSNVQRNQFYDKILLPSKELAEAMLALCQLIQLRDCYNDGWAPNWGKDIKFTIEVEKDCPVTTLTGIKHAVLAFKSKDLCKEFYNNFKDLIETAKPLL